MIKKGLKQLYPGLPRTTIRAIINPIIAQSRGISIRQAKKIKALQPNELKRFIAIVGRPIQPGQNIDEHTPTKKYLVNKYPDVSRKLILDEINRIIREYRHYPGAEREKILLPKEYELFKQNFE